MKEGWTHKRLGDIAEIKGGKRLPKGVKLLTTPTKHPYIRVADFNDFGTIDTDDIHYISDNVYEQIKRYIIKKEDVYISIAGTIGKSGIIPDSLDGANLTENACRLVLSNNMYQRYVYYFTISPSFIKQIDERTKKSAQPKLALTRLSDVIISYPTIEEQQSIVDYLDSAFAKIDAMKANAEKALNEAQALFQASLKEMLEPKEGWEEKTLGDVATFINGDRSTNYPSKRDYVIDGIPFVNAGNIIQTGLALDSLNLISQSKYDSLTQGKFVEGDILFCLRGTLGKHSIVQSGLKGAIASSLVIIRTKDGFSNKFISYFLDYKQPFIERLNNGAAQPNIPAKTMKDFPILLPTNEKQQQIVATLDSLKSKVDRLQENYNKISRECDALKQAILRQVFE